MHKLGDLFCTWEALVDELEVIVVELVVLLELILLALEELVDLGQP